MKTRLPLLFLSTAALALCQEPNATCGPVMTDKGAVSGSVAGSSCVFKGVPYAQPPIGALRFRPPVPHDQWSGVLATTTQGNRCPQLDANNNSVGAEDCLFINLWAPVLAHPTLDEESPQKISGNYGFLDEIAALQWVQRNIAAFGGDPTRVTLFGMSAGGEDVENHLVSPLSKGLFSAAILESPGVSFDAVPTLEQSEKTTGSPVAAATGCATQQDVASCLRALPMAKLVEAVPGVGSTIAQNNYGPIVDGYVIPAAPIDVMAADSVSAGRGVRTASCDFWDAHPELSIWRSSKLD